MRCHHLPFDQHEIIRGNGGWSERTYLGAQTVATLHEVAVQELLTLFPDLHARLGTGAVARPVARHFEGALCSPA